MGKRNEKEIYRIENTDYLASKEPIEAIRIIKKAYGLKYLMQAYELYTQWRIQYIKGIKRW